MHPGDLPLVLEPGLLPLRVWLLERPIVAWPGVNRGHQLVLDDHEPSEDVEVLGDGVTVEWSNQGSLRGLAAHERAIAGAHRRMVAWAIDEGYDDVVDGEVEGIASALVLDDGVCDWEQLGWRPRWCR